MNLIISQKHETKFFFFDDCDESQGNDNLYYTKKKRKFVLSIFRYELFIRRNTELKIFVGVFVSCLSDRCTTSF